MSLRQFATGAAILAPAPAAFAHSTIEGIGDFYNGLAHPFVVPAHAMLLIALGLLLGQQGTEHVRRGLPAFAAALALALLLSNQATALPLPGVLLGAGTLTGLLLAAALPLPGWSTLLLALLAGVLVGIDSDPGNQAGIARLTTLAGTWLAASFAVLWFFVVADMRQKAWQRIAVRVAGSWIAAIAIMVLALGAVS